MAQHAIIMLLAGIGIPVLAALNAALGVRIGSPAAAATVLFVVAFLCCVVVVLITGTGAFSRFAQAPKHLFLGGVLIAFYVLTITYLFAAIKLEKKVMFIILTLIIAVAAFNIVSTLVMGVTEKKSDIAILRTIGVDQKSIMYIFIAQGFIIGALGTLLGIIFGVTISLNISTIVPFIEGLFNTEFLAKDIYLISTVPSKVIIADIYRIGLMGLSLSLVASIYPSYKASKTDPATALKYE